MKSIRRTTLGFFIGLWAFGAAADSYFSTQNTNWPPLPGNFLAVPAIGLGDDNFLLLDQDVDYAKVQEETEILAAVERALKPPSMSSYRIYRADAGSGECASELAIGVSPTNAGNTLTLTITNATDGVVYDLFRTFELLGDNATNSLWRWVGRGTNGQNLTFLNVRCGQAYYVLGCDADSDGDGLTDAFEKLVSRTSPTTNQTYAGDLDDRAWWLRSNILVNDPDQDYGNEQNSQFETTCVVVGSNVVVAWVDSNQGVYSLGSPTYVTRTPRLVAYAVSHDGGVTFEDMGVPPLARAGGATNDDGDAGDPVLALDRTSGTVYLAGTSPRNSGHQGIPLWKSTDGGATFTDPVIVRDDITSSDKPWIAVDNAAGTGQHDVYLACIGDSGYPSSTNALWLSASTDGYGTNWSSPVAIRQNSVDNVNGIQSVIPLVGPDHTAYAFWFEHTSDGTNWLKMRQILNRGAALGGVNIVRSLTTTNLPNGNLKLLRSNTATNTDWFSAFPFPVPAANPVKTNHLYVAYADRGTNADDKADIFFLQSTSGGATWTNLVRVNTDTTTKDQWMPVLAVKPDGTQLFMAWYDRRNDTNNSLIDMYGRFGTIATNGDVTFSTNDFRITTTNFPPVFAGTDTNNLPDGQYDPVYPPEGVNLHWWYPGGL